MTRQLRILALTDHLAHESENSIYRLLHTLSLHPRALEVSIASRGVVANKPFFNELQPIPLQVQPIGPQFTYGTRHAFFEVPGRERYIGEYDLLLFRLPRPITAGFFKFVHAAYDKPGGIMINSPLGIEETSTKAFLTHFPELCPPLRMVHNSAEIDAFRKDFPIVLKPLENYGGKGIVRIENEWVWEGNRQIPYEDFARHYDANPSEMLGMKFLKNVHLGDKRIILVNGHIVGVSLRIPGMNSWLCNAAQGGVARASRVEPEELQIIRRLAPVLKEKGIVFFGLDTLVDDNGKRVLSEINTLSVGGLVPAENLHKRPLVKMAVQALMNFST